jgi:hypothetical protein
MCSSACVCRQMSILRLRSPERPSTDGKATVEDLVPLCYSSAVGLSPVVRYSLEGGLCVELSFVSVSFVVGCV